MAGAKALPPSLRDSLKTRISPDAYHPVERMSRTGRKLFGLQSRQWTAPTSAGRTTACHAAAAQLVEPSKLRADVPRPEGGRPARARAGRRGAPPAPRAEDSYCPRPL